MTKKVSPRSGFTLLEILLVVGIISILAGIVILAINPTKQLGDTRNAQRRSDVLTILNAVYQYSIDQGDMTTIVSGISAIYAGTSCASSTGTDAYDLSAALVGSGATYLTAVPIDPTDGVADTSSSYFLSKNATTGRITVCATSAENSATISVTR